MTQLTNADIEKRLIGRGAKPKPLTVRRTKPKISVLRPQIANFYCGAPGGLVSQAQAVAALQAPIAPSAPAPPPAPSAPAKKFAVVKTEPTNKNAPIGARAPPAGTKTDRPAVGKLKLSASFEEQLSKALQGKGFSIKNVKDFIKGRPAGVYPPKVRKFIATRGKFMIMGVSVVRQPLSAAITRAINVLSLGKVAKSMKQLNIDKLRHLYVVLDIMDPRTNRMSSWMIEKNETITVAEHSDAGHIGHETLDLGAPKEHLDVGGLFGLLHAEDANINVYDSVKANCQDFAAHVLKILGLWNASVSKFVKQDLTKLITPFYRKASKAITDAGSRLSILYEGAGESCGGCAGACGGKITQDSADLSRLTYSNAEYTMGMREITAERSRYAY